MISPDRKDPQKIHLPPPAGFQIDLIRDNNNPCRAVLRRIDQLLARVLTRTATWKSSNESCRQLAAMIRPLKSLAKPIRVGLIGAGCMGSGIAHQISLTPGMSLEWIVAKRPRSAQNLAQKTGAKTGGSDSLRLLQDHPVDVLVEASNTIWAAYQPSRAALENGAHVVLMNAEVDLIFGPQLCRLAASKDLIVTSDAGDQHGVLARMIHEIQLWGFEIVQAGNVKGFLNRYATSAELTHEAAKRNLSPLKCCSFTDGTKLNIEMALLANAFALLPTRIGMTGPVVMNIDEALQVFDHPTGPNGCVDYILGAQPGGGVYVIGKCDDPNQHPYLEYYKIGTGPYYLFKRTKKRSRYILPIIQKFIRSITPSKTSIKKTKLSNKQAPFHTTRKHCHQNPATVPN